MFFPRLEKNELELLKKRSKNNKELNLLLNENNVHIKTIDDLKNLPNNLKSQMMSLKFKNLNINPYKNTYKQGINDIFNLIKNDKIFFK